MTRQPTRAPQKPSSPRSPRKTQPAAVAASPRTESRPPGSRAPRKPAGTRRLPLPRPRKSPWKIGFSNQQTRLAVTSRLVRRAVDAVLRHERVKSAEISVAVVDDAAIHAINRDFLDHDFPTDVISFLLEERAASQPARRGARAMSPPADLPRGRGKTLSGEVVVSAETAQRRAVDFGWDGLDELVLYLVHGLLHLCGYDDLTRGEQKLMRRRETEVLATLGLVPGYDEEA